MIEVENTSLLHPNMELKSIMESELIHGEV